MFERNTTKLAQSTPHIDITNSFKGNRNSSSNNNTSMHVGNEEVVSLVRYAKAGSSLGLSSLLLTKRDCMDYIHHNTVSGNESDLIISMSISPDETTHVCLHESSNVVLFTIDNIGMLRT